MERPSHILPNGLSPISINSDARLRATTSPFTILYTTICLLVKVDNLNSGWLVARDEVGLSESKVRSLPDIYLILGETINGIW